MVEGRHEKRNVLQFMVLSGTCGTTLTVGKSCEGSESGVRQEEIIQHLMSLGKGLAMLNTLRSCHSKH
jgi:hypothetical protein